MSGSFDNRPPMRRNPPAPAAYDPYEEGLEQAAPPHGSQQYYPSRESPATQPTGRGEPHQNWETEPVPSREPEPRDEHLYAEARTNGPEQKHKHAGIVPAGSITGRSLTLVIAIMCFLACLTAGAVYMINKSADGWLKDMASEVTVQVEPRSGTDSEKVIKDTVAFLTKEPGVTSVKALTLDESAALLEPWLGQADVLKSLPVPRLIALEIDRGSPPDLEALRQRLTSQFSGVTLDDHRHWQQQIRTVTRSFALGGLLILLLVAAATIAIIESATRSSMASHRDIVEVLHFVGATDRFIAREFESHFLKLGIKAGLVGALAACAVFLVAPYLVELIGGQTVTAVELRQLVGSGTLELLGYALMGVVVIVVAGLCMITSRLGVYRILNSHI
ncbi:MAG: ABC transporter permease [Hyphomicrobiaceae bacterium]